MFLVWLLHFQFKRFNNTMSTQAEELSQVAQQLASAPKELNDAFAHQFESLIQAGVLDKAIKTGSVAPDFTITSVFGDTVSLSELLKQGPVVLSFYRGGWCPFCNIQFKYFNKIFPEVKKLGASLVAISGETKENGLDTVSKTDAKFIVATDSEFQIARKYGLVSIF